MEKKETSDMVNHPKHYAQGDIECIDAMISAYGGGAVEYFCVLNAFKYIWRCCHKSKFTEDLEKADWYINKAIEISKD